MTDTVIRAAMPADRTAINAVIRSAFGQPDEARLVDALVADGDVVLELVALRDDRLVGHVLFSRLSVAGPAEVHNAVALAPVSVAPDAQRGGIGSALIEAAHRELAAAGERLSIVLGDPAYYGRFGYRHDRAAGFDSDYQCAALQALAFGDAPVSGRLVYARAFGGL